MKSNTSYTPGPWEVHKSESGYTYVFGQEGGLPVCELKSREEVNARLIAAAPDLLEACKTAALSFKTCGLDFEYLGKAIAKAEGRI